MNKGTRKRILPILIQRDGRRCNVCKDTERELVIDHIDNDDSNNELSNLQVLCRRHNYLKNPRRKKGNHSHVCVCVGVCVCGNVSASVDRLEQRKSAELEKSQVAEPSFRHWLYWEMKQQGMMKAEDALNAGAEVAQCSQETVRRYLKKVCSIAGMYDVVDGLIQFKHNYANHFNGRKGNATKNNTSTKG
ncbi:MAG TPA: HNH endonuclease signature motif containing protein [Bacteroidota bacterium]